MRRQVEPQPPAPWPPPPPEPVPSPEPQPPAPPQPLFPLLSEAVLTPTADAADVAKGTD